MNISKAVFTFVLGVIPLPLLAAETSRLPVVSNEQAWKRLPPAKGKLGQLPIWARVLANPLPRTTAAMLELDYLHRAKNPLGPKLCAKLRWQAAQANHCLYSRAVAEADLRRAGITADQVREFQTKPTGSSPAESAALAFAEKMTRAAYTVTDEEVAGLIKQYGADKVMAMVHLLAHANFQDRIFLALGIKQGQDSKVAPLEVIKFSFNEKVTVPKRRTAKAGPAAVPKDFKNKDWLKLNHGDLQKAKNQQQARKPRIPVPTWKELQAKLPPEQRKQRPSRIIWNLACFYHQPELTQAWYKCMRNFGREAKMDRVFANTAFWIVTRSNQCFY